MVVLHLIHNTECCASVTYYTLIHMYCMHACNVRLPLSLSLSALFPTAGLTSGRRPWLDESGVPLRRLDAYPHPPKRPPPTPPKSHSSQHNCPHRHHSHVHVHSIRHHHLCPLHGSHGTDERVEGYYDDYENTPQ